ncbi:hypothetical protein C8R41DRAFT_843438 [Lentinula lateritia]|uniref:Secreted protein n=1 Tax=Lentinula lateritia TaxID=40482 RepID=A0ABQ8V8F8_9AGAR|nr:hypothetical protein C8R41DRAFT_843438 [Lentinula lateritia]
MFMVSKFFFVNTPLLPCFIRVSSALTRTLHAQHLLRLGPFTTPAGLYLRLVKYLPYFSDTRYNLRRDL